jgi:ABC-2 type transport system ATP-binding protein
MAADASPTVVVEQLVKRYGDFEAIKGISFTVQPGEIVGFLGPNGAGKTTTMKILTCFMAASSGTARVAGHDVYEASDEVRKRTGYLPENVPLYDDMMVWDYLHFIAEIRGIPRAERTRHVERVIRLTGLESMVHRDISELSKGYRQRVGLAQAIVHEPDVLILDEPTSGLDPNQLVEIRDLIKEIGREKTVLFSTHILQEVAAVCDRIILIHHGVLVADGPLDTLLAESGSDDLEELFRSYTSSPPREPAPNDDPSEPEEQAAVDDAESDQSNEDTADFDDAVDDAHEEEE